MKAEIQTIVETKYWHRLEDGRIQCDVCPRACKLKEGQRGMCFVRARQENQIVLTTYGRSSGFCVDPIEKKPLNHFLPGTPVLSFGTAGCNLACKYCQNWDISKSREIDTLADAASPETIASAAHELGCRSVAFTYNDPVIFMEYAIDVAQACREVGIKTVAVTAGYMCAQPRIDFYRHMDAANVDLKAFTDDFYKTLCAGTLQPVLDTLIYLKHETDVWFEITNLIIPGHNDGERELEAMTQWVVKELGPDVKNGVRYAYTGNVHDERGDSTYCHNCGTRLIGRDWYILKAWNLTEGGRCNVCQTPCPGVFEDQPGKWGAKRLPLNLRPTPK
jgi:pyruvate formate lyase activating enzyme